MLVQHLVPTCIYKCLPKVFALSCWNEGLEFDQGSWILQQNLFQWEFQDRKMGGTVPYKAIFCGDIPLHRPYIGLIYGRYLQFRFLKWPLIFCRFSQPVKESCYGTMMYFYKLQNQSNHGQFKMVRRNVNQTGETTRCNVCKPSATAQISICKRQPAIRSLLPSMIFLDALWHTMTKHDPSEPHRLIRRYLSALKTSSAKKPSKEVLFLVFGFFFQKTNSKQGDSS